MCRHGHDCSAAVAHHDIVGDPDGDLLSVDRIDRKGSGGDSGLFLVETTLHVGLAGAGRDVGFDGFFLPGGRDFCHERMLGSKHHVGRSEESIGTSSEDGDVIALDIEDDLGTFRAADPIALEGFDRLRPIEWFELVDETLGVFGNAKHPLPQRTALDGFAFVFPLLDLFVGQDGAHAGRPVHGCFMDEGETDIIDLILAPAFRLELGYGLGLLVFVAEIGIIQLEENPLGPADILGIGGVHFTIPIVAEAEFLKLTAEVVGIGLGSNARMLAGLDSVLLGRQSEGIPTHWVENVEAIHALVATDDVSGSVSLGVPNVQTLARRIWEHVENVVFRLGRIEALIARTGSTEGFIFGPMGLPFGFELVERVGLAFVRHDVERERNREWWEKHAKNTSEMSPFSLGLKRSSQAIINFLPTRRISQGSDEVCSALET